MSFRDPDDPVERFIALIRAIDPIYMDELFRNGGCYHLHLILREMFPDAEPWYRVGHVYVRIGRRWYDIRGRRRRPSDWDFHPMSEDEMREGEKFLASRLADRIGPCFDSRVDAIARILKADRHAS